jgi:homoserine dehydrogenase
MAENLKIGIFGFGCVGQGLYDILNHSEGFRAEVVKICVKDRTKKRSLDSHFFTFDKNDILHNPEIDLVVELINDAVEAYDIVTTSLKQGKRVVTANKKMVADHLPELVQLQQEYGGILLYEASVCGSIPIIRNLEEYYDHELLYSLNGIVNGSSNYILSKIFNENLSYSTALKQAQELGFAETDPTLDVGGFDALSKLCILTLHAYGVFVKPEEVFNYGIQQLSAHDIQFAREKNYKIKLIASVQKTPDGHIAPYVFPQFVTPDDYLYRVENEYNGVTVEAAFADKQFFMGKGAGGHPTGSAVLSDISASTYHYRYEYKKLAWAHSQNEASVSYSQDLRLEVYLRYRDEKDLALFDFEEISEKFQGRGLQYVIGVVKLSRLVELKTILPTLDIFLVNTGRKVSQKARQLQTDNQELSLSIS